MTLSLTPVVAGFAAKRVSSPPEALQAHGVTEVLSLSGCVSTTMLADPKRSGLFLGLFAEEAAAELLIQGRASDFRLLALGVIPIVFEDGHRRPMAFPAEPPRLELARSSWHHRGYDVVQIGDDGAGGYWFACSPLSCNYEAERTPVNQYCLVDSLDDALRVAARFSIDKPEPGAYAAFEVWERVERPVPSAPG